MISFVLKVTLSLFLSSLIVVLPAVRFKSCW